MSNAEFKFGGRPDDTEHDFGNTWSREVYPNYSRLTIGPSSGHIDVMLRLAEQIPPPYGLLYVLVVPLAEHEPGRYQSPVFNDLGEVTSLLSKYRDFFEKDGRHHLWLMNVTGQGQLIYDNHNVIYAYGPLDAFESVLDELNFVRTEEISFPSPHTHYYHASMIKQEEAIFKECDWSWCPLVEEHDDP